MKVLSKILVSSLTFFTFFSTIDFVRANQDITVIPLIKTSNGLGGKDISYPRWRKAELRLFKVNIPVGLKTPIHTHPAPLMVYVLQGKLKHVRGEEVNYFKEGDSFVESNKGTSHFVESVGKRSAILFVGVSSVKGMPTTIND